MRLPDQRLAYPRGASYRTVQSLSAFNGESLGGRWELCATDHATSNTGTLNRWCMHWSGPALFSDGVE